MTPEPIHIISLGAGVQSSTMALMAAKGEITPMPVAAVFADTKAEPKAVYEWLKYLTKELPFPIITVSAGSLRAKMLRSYFLVKNQKQTSLGIPAFVRNKDGSQGLMTRQCTKDFKVSPVDKAITALMRKHHVRRASKWLGISTDEIWRAKLSKRTTVEHRFPMLEARMNRAACLKWMEKHGYPKPPRSACIFCPYRSNEEWRALLPSELKSAISFEKQFQKTHSAGTMQGTPWLHRQMIPLGKVDLSTEEEKGQGNMFNNECEGMCGV